MQIDNVADLQQQQQVVPPLWTTRDVSLRSHQAFRSAGSQQGSDTVLFAQHTLTKPVPSISSSAGCWASTAMAFWQASLSGMWCWSMC